MLETDRVKKASRGKFCKDVVTELKSLNIPDAKFSVRFSEYDELSANLSSANGSDGVSFLLLGE